MHHASAISVMQLERFVASYSLGSVMQLERFVASYSLGSVSI